MVISDDGTPTDTSWEGVGGRVSRLVLEQSERCLRSYEANPSLVEEHANIERSTTQGGYGRRQLYELVQNGADELQRDPGGGIHVVLTSDTLYCANLGTPVTPEGVETILASHLSRKRGAEIGRFGLGFKSVLSVSQRPQFFSRTGSFGWDAAEAEARIRERVSGDGPTPVLRLASLLDPLVERTNDPVLAELTTWASTVVKLPLLDEHVARLADDVRDFPGRFAIFSPHVGRVVLEDRRDPERVFRRVIRVEADDRRRSLIVEAEGKTARSEWMVFSTVHSPSPKAKREAAEYHGRDRIPVAWAVPTSGQQGLGEFWAFFPTMWETTLRGVLNAPWKTNEDRQNLIKNSAFNDELMDVAARLIVDSLPRLITPEDPARHLDLITARGKEARNWADEMLTGLVYHHAARRPSLPNQEGLLCEPSEVRLHPERLDSKWLEMWASYPRRPLNWCHRSVEDKIRRSRVETILHHAGRQPAEVGTWLEALVSDGRVEASATALAIVADMVAQGHPAAEEARQAAILLTENGAMVPPVADTVFRRTPMDSSADDLLFVAPALQEDEETARALDVLGIREADALGRLAAAIRPGLAGYGNADWKRFWALTRAAGAERALKLLREQSVDVRWLRVRTAAGAFVPLRSCLLPGKVIPEGTREDARVVVDVDFHRADIGMLRELGLLDGPGASIDPTTEDWFERYRGEALRAYYEYLPSDVSRPNRTNILVEGVPPAGPLGILPKLSPGARARYLASVPETGLVPLWEVRARTRPDITPMAFDSPLVWMARKHGALPTSRGVRPVSECVGPGLREYESMLPVADVVPESARVLALPERVDRIPGRAWTKYFEETLERESDDAVGGFYALAASAGRPAPGRLRCRDHRGWGSRAAKDVAVAVDRARYDLLIAHEIPAILVPDTQAASRLVDAWSLRRHEQVLVTELRAEAAGPSTPAEDVFPRLRLLAGRPLRDVSLVRCRDLDELIRTPAGQVSRPLDIGRDGSTVYWREDGDDLSLLEALGELLGLGLSTESCRQILRHRDEVRKNERFIAVRRQRDDADRLKAMLPASVMREKLPRGLVEHVEHEEGPVDDRTIAELTLSVYGTGTLKKFRPELEDRGFVLPTQMAGGSQARSFISALGFSTEFAGFSSPPLDPVVSVDGPVELPPLHDYQERMVDRVTAVLRSSPAQRGMLSLPTGAGKTRVAVEAAIRMLRGLPPEKVSVPLLWIAQTEELCEQAVQSWQFIWKSIGPRRRLTISRLWTWHNVDPVTEDFHVVVATDAKLESIIDRPEYEWLRDAQAIVVDEAHTSLSRRYTELMAALGAKQRGVTRCPLVGLSATPFRGTDEGETKRLATRYGNRRLDHDPEGGEILGEDPYSTLQDLKVLARVEHRELAGADLDLDAEERASLEKLRRLPPTAEKRLGQDHRRNRMLIETICSLPDDWPVLLFATSVDHARTIAALLSRRAVSAAAVSSDTDVSVRRHTIDQFKHGRIRVLANYGVLSQGFDAPATRAVIVARPTYSPNVYQQMIGRGLRGPRNGGKDECLIVNVADNIAQFGEELAFRKFEHLWREQATDE